MRTITSPLLSSLPDRGGNIQATTDYESDDDGKRCISAVSVVSMPQENDFGAEKERERELIFTDTLLLRKLLPFGGAASGVYNDGRRKPK